MTIIVRTTPRLAHASGQSPTGWVHHQHMYEEDATVVRWVLRLQGAVNLMSSMRHWQQCRAGVERGRVGVGVGLTTHSRNKNMKITLYGVGKLNGSCKTLNCNDARLTVRPHPQSLPLLSSPLKLVWKLVGSFSFAWQTLRAWPKFYDVIDKMRWRTRLLFFYYNIIYSVFPSLIFTAPREEGEVRGGIGNTDLSLICTGWQAADAFATVPAHKTPPDSLSYLFFMAALLF